VIDTPTVRRRVRCSPPGIVPSAPQRLDRLDAGNGTAMFVMFSNRLGCIGSLLVSALLTLAIVAVMRGCNHA
jgi:hypothetical protein